MKNIILFLINIIFIIILIPYCCNAEIVSAEEFASSEKNAAEILVNNIFSFSKINEGYIVNIVDNIVYINLNQEETFIGQRFNVYKQLATFKTKHTGMVEVINVYTNYSLCRIISGEVNINDKVEPCLLKVALFYENRGNLTITDEIFRFIEIELKSVQYSNILMYKTLSNKESNQIENFQDQIEKICNEEQVDYILYGTNEKDEKVYNIHLYLYDANELIKYNSSFVRLKNYTLYRITDGIVSDINILPEKVEVNLNSNIVKNQSALNIIDQLPKKIIGVRVSGGVGRVILDNTNIRFFPTSIGQGYLEILHDNQLTKVPINVCKVPELTQAYINPTEIEILCGESKSINIELFDQYANKLNTTMKFEVAGSIGEILEFSNDIYIFVATHEGTGSITISCDNKVVKVINVTVLPSKKLNNIEIKADLKNIIVGETTDIVMICRDQYGEEMEINLVWEITDNIGFLTYQNDHKYKFSATNVGEGTLKVYYDSNNFEEVPISIIESPKLTTIRINPNPIVLDDENKAKIKIQFFDQYSNSMNFSLWQCSSDIGRLEYMGEEQFIFTGNSNKEVAGKINIGNLVSKEISVEYKPPRLVNIEVKGDFDNLLIGQSRIVEIDCYDQYGDQMMITPLWAVSNSLGKLDYQSKGLYLFEATSDGEGFIKVYYKGIFCEIPIKVIESPRLDRIKILPKPIELDDDNKAEITIQFIDQYGEEMQYSEWQCSSDIGSITHLHNNEFLFEGLSSKKEKGKIIVDKIIEEIDIKYQQPILFNIEVIGEFQNIMRGQAIDVQIICYDQYGEEIVMNPFWSITNSLGNLIHRGSNKYLFEATSVGEGVLRVYLNGSFKEVVKEIPIKIIESSKLSEVEKTPKHSSMITETKEGVETLKGLTEEQAIKIIKQRGFKPYISYEITSDTEVGCVSWEYSLTEGGVLPIKIAVSPYQDKYNVFKDDVALEKLEEDLIMKESILYANKNIFDKIGIIYGYSSINKIITLKYQTTLLRMQINSNEAELVSSNTKIQLDFLPVIINNRAMVPIAIIEEFFGDYFILTFYKNNIYVKTK